MLTKHGDFHGAQLLGRSTLAAILMSLLLLALLSFQYCLAEVLATNRSTNGTQEFRLSCEPGEQRHFNYESATMVWGSTNQQVYLRAALRLSCMEPSNNNTLKYLAEVLSVSGDFGDVISYKKAHQFKPSSDGSAELRTEPVLEDVGEAISDAADRVKRSVSGWFTKTWGSVKDFFVNIFTSSEKTTVTREDAFRESGIDISSQCRSNKPPKGLPIDDSVFDDLEPKYYIGASTGGGGDSYRGAAYDFDASDHDDVNEAAELEATISFFDDPKPTKSRSKRATSSGKQDNKLATGKRARALSSQYDLDHERLLRLPFIFIQSRTGRVVEVRFSSEESDLSVKNFKRHLCDLFATNLDGSKSQTNEISPIGEHSTRYIVDPTLNSSYIRQSLLKSAAVAGADPTKLLVKALASHQVVGQGDPDGLDQKDPKSERPVEGRAPVDGDQGGSISVLRSINSTSSLQMNSRTMTPDIDQIQVRVKQVQQISEGRMVGSAGQLGMSLVQGGGGSGGLSPPASSGAGGKLHRATRSTQGPPLVDKQQQLEEQLDDIADMLKVSTSFSVKLVPPGKLGNFNDLTSDSGGAIGRTTGDARTKRSTSSSSKGDSLIVSGSAGETSGGDSRKAANSDSAAHKGSEVVVDNKRRSAQVTSGDNNGQTATPAPGAIKAAKRGSREPLVVRPDDQQHLQRLLTEWRQLESRLQFTPSNLLPESSDLDGQTQRLEILRDQIQMRLNEEFMRNRLRRGARAGPASAAILEQPGGPESAGKLQVSQGNDLGLGLTQLILDSGVTAKRKGSVYGTLEEVFELEMALDEDGREGSVSRLMRDTVRVDKLRNHCKSAIASVAELASANSRVEIKSPFGLLEEEQVVGQSMSNERLSRLLGQFQVRNRHKLEQCKQVVQLLLRVGDKQAAELVLELMDECNNRLLAVAKHEELGHGPSSRYYRGLRQQFTELMANINRPSEPLLDKLVARLHYSKLDSGVDNKHKTTPVAVAEPPPGQEFTYVAPTTTGGSQKPKQQVANEATSYNKSLLREEDNYNNNEGAGSLVMTITALAARPSIGRHKRVETVEKLLMLLRSSSCSLFNGPDLDILESMGNFHEPLDEMVGKVVHLARRCRHQDQYLVACVHALQGQLRHPATQRFLVEQLRASNSSCTVKSEIVLTLIGAILVDELQPASRPAASGRGQMSNQILPAASSGQEWPLVGLNQVDDTLLELVDDQSRLKPNGKSGAGKSHHAQDRKCLKQLVAYYLGKKRAGTWTNDIGRPASGGAEAAQAKRAGRAGPKRNRREVRNEDQFWDEAQCKRWAMPDPNYAGGSMSPGDYSGISSTDLLDEIDDNSILLALANNKPTGGGGGGGGGSTRSGRRSQKLIEREAELPGQVNSTTTTTTTSGSNNGTAALVPIIRRRHKCTASKSFGPKNAQAQLRAEIVNDLVGARDENKFLARFRLATNFLGNRIDIGRMYLWHQKHTTRAHVNILGKSLWDTSHGCEDKAPRHLLYMPLFDFNLWLVKVSVGLRLHSEMGFFSNCDSRGLAGPAPPSSSRLSEVTGGSEPQGGSTGGGGQLELYPTMTVRASGEASAKFVVARAGMSLASHYGYQGSIRVSQQPESCMSVLSAHQPMNITFASWFQLWDSDCHYWGSRNKAQPQATKWKLLARKPSVWLQDECLSEPRSPPGSPVANSTSGSPALTMMPLAPSQTSDRSPQTISP